MKEEEIIKENENHIPRIDWKKKQNKCSGGIGRRCHVSELIESIRLSRRGLWEGVAG